MERRISTLKNLPKLQLPSQTPKAITLPKIEAVPTLPRLAIPTQTVYNQRYKAMQDKAKEDSYTQFGGLKDANDPYALNSFADAVFNRKAKEKRYGDFAETLHKIPILGDLITGVVAAADVAAQSTYDLFTGDFQALGINAVTNFSETIDILANPVKSLITPLVNKDTSDPKYQLPWYERLASGFGFSEHGRYNYDYDTGFWLSDLGLEIISDPINIIAAIFSGGGSAALKIGGKQLAKEVSSELGEQIAKQGLKAVSKAGLEISEEALQKTITKKTIKNFVNKTVNLRNLGNKISASTKRLAKLTKDDGLRILSQDLDEAIYTTKGIINDTTKSTIKSITDAVEVLTKQGNLDKKALNTVKDLTNLLDDFNKTADFKLIELLRKYIGSTSDKFNVKLNKAGKLERKALRKAINETTDSNALKALQEQLDTLFSSPYYRKKYKHVINLDSTTLEELGNAVDLTDFLDAANTFYKSSKSFKLASAMDQLLEGTQAIDSAILKLSLNAASPLVPFATRILRPGIVSLFKSVSDTKFGKYTINHLKQNLDDIAQYFKNKFANATVLVYAELKEAYQQAFKQFDLFSGSDLQNSGFEKELAQSIYNDTFNWLRGYGDYYAPRLSDNLEQHLDNLQEGKPVNILQASPEEQKNQIWLVYQKRFEELGVTEDESVEYFYKEVDRMGQLGFGMQPLQDWSIQEYVSQLRITDAILVARNAYKDFDEVLSKGIKEQKQASSVLKYVKDFEAVNVTSPTGALNQALEQLGIIGVYTDGFADIEKIRIKVSETFKDTKFKSRQKGAKGVISNRLQEFADTATEAFKAYQELDRLVRAKAEDWAIWAQEDACFDNMKRLQGAAYQLRRSLLDYSKVEGFADTDFDKLFKVVQKMSSPSYGQAYKAKLEFKTFYEILNSQRLATIDILKNKEFQEFINAFRPGQDASKLLDIAKQNALNMLENTDDSVKVTGKEILNKIELIKSTVDSVDAFVEHMALVKQSNLPEFMQEIYLDVLAEMPIQDASEFMQHFDANASEVIRRMNEHLTNRYAAHTYDQDYLATQLLEIDGFKASAERYLNSSRTITDEAAFVEATYKAKVLPEFSKKIKNDLGEETNQYVYRAYGSYADKQKVFISFRTSGDNPNLDDISDLGFKFKDKTWAFDSNKDEIDNLLELYKQLRTISESGETVFITHNAQQNHIDFLRTRLYELLEETYIKGSGNPELLRAYEYQKLIKADTTEILEQLQETVDPEYQKLFRQLSEAQQWFNRNLYYSRLDCVDLLKKFDGVPTVNEYYYDIKNRLLTSYVRRQSACGGKLNLALDETILDSLKNIPDLDISDLQKTVDSLSSVFKKVQNYGNTLFAKGSSSSINGHMLIDGDYYKKGIHSTTADTIRAHEIQIADPTELLKLNEDGRWVYRNIILSKDITDVHQAVRYLKDNGITYAPKWKALNPEQQLSTYPVMINGKVTLQQIEGVQPVVIKKYIDPNLIHSLFDIQRFGTEPYTKSYKMQHIFTIVAEQASEILKQIQNPRAIELVAPNIEQLWNEVIGYAKSYKGSTSPYAFLKDDLNIYQKYAVLTVLIKDRSIDAPWHSLKNKLKEKAGLIDTKRFIKDMGYEAPIKPKDLSKPWNGFKGIAYSKLKNLPGYQQGPNYVWYNAKMTLRSEHTAGDVYFSTLKKIRSEEPTVSYYEASSRAYDAYREAIKNHNANVAIKRKEIYEANKLLLDEHKKAVDQFNEELKEELHNKYLEEQAFYEEWWADIKEKVKEAEAIEQQKPEIQIENALRKKVSQLIYKPEYNLHKKSSFRRIFEENQNYASLGYSNATQSKSSYIDYIYNSEMRGTVDKARELFDAIQEVNQDVLNSTKAFKAALERPKASGQFRSVYAPGMQRHATLGMSLIKLNNTVVDIAKTFDGPAFDAFLACDKQVVNNLEDLMLLQILKLNTEDLISFVHHQGKGVAIIPVGKYLTDRTAHNFDIRMDIEQFLTRFGNYDSDILGVKKSGDNLILYIKDYKFHVKQQDINRITLEDVDFDRAFTSAYGYSLDPNVIDQFYKDNMQLLQRFDKNSYEYQDHLNHLYNEYRKAYGVNTKQSAFLMQHYEEIQKLRFAYKRHFDSLRRLSVDYDAQYAFMKGGYGRTMDYQNYKAVMDYLPASIRKEIGIVDDLELEHLFGTETGDIFNFTTLGRAAYRLDVEPYATSNYQSIMAGTYRSMAYNLSAATQYAQFYFEDSPWTLRNFFQYAKSPDEIYIALKSTDAYTVSTLGVDAKGLPVVKELKINDVSDLQKALNANAIITPTTTYGSIAQTLNNKRWSSSKFKWFHKLSYYTKMSMLILNPGFIFRNLIDSTLKNVLISENKDQVLSNYLEAMDLYRRYQETIDLLFAVSNGQHPFRPDTLEIVFKDSTAPLTEAQFMMIHNFYENGPSAGSIQKVSDYYLQQSMKKGKVEHSTLQKFIDNCMKPTKDLEDITRFAAYIEATKRGLTNTDAFELIRKTHFDYGTKTNTQHWLELIFPFYSFKLKNFEFWLDFAVRNPQVTYNLLQMATNEWNWEDIDFDRIEYYQSQLNHMTQGNIQLNREGLTLKLSPSLMDPVNMLLNPIEAFSGSVAPWMQPIVDAMQQDEPYNYGQLVGTTAGAALATVPGLGMAGMGLATGSQYANRFSSGIRNAQRTSSGLPLILPSVFGSVKTPAQYGKASYTNSRAYMDAEFRRPRRVNIYNKYYTDTGKNRWKIRFYPIDAATVQYRVRDNQNRFR